MEVSGQIHAPAALLPRKNILVPITLEAQGSELPILILCRDNVTSDIGGRYSKEFTFTNLTN